MSSLIGKGAHGEIHKITDNKGRVYAQKTLSIQDAAVYNECDCMLRFDHPHLVRALQASMRVPKVYLVMELGDMDLWKWRRQQPDISFDVVVWIAYQLISACHFLYQQGYYHCDIKPQNVLVFQSTSEVPIVKLADLGLAFPFEYQLVVCGTPTWTSPEGLSPEDSATLGDGNAGADEPLVGDRKKQMHTQADIFSLGTTLWFTLFGNPIIQTVDKTNAIPSIIKDTIHKYEQMEGGEELVSFLQMLQQMCHLDPSQRYVSYASILQSSECFRERVYTTPIGGVVKVTSMPTHHLTIVEDSFKQMCRTLLQFIASKCQVDGNGLIAIVAISMLYRCWPLVNEQTAPATVAAIGWMASNFLDNYIPIGEVVGLFGQQFTRDALMLQTQAVFNHLKGILRVPTVYDVALTQDEVRWAIMLYSDKCKYLHYEPMKLHQHYITNVETEHQKVDARVPKSAKVAF